MSGGGKRPRIGLVEKGWRLYAEHALPANAPAIQKRETKRAFYAGAGLIFENLTNAVGPEDVSEDAGVEIMVAVDAEVRAFLEDVKRGRA